MSSLVRFGITSLLKRMPILSPNRLEVPIVSSFREIRTKRSEQSASASHTRTEILEEESPFDPPEVEEFFSKINHEIATKANRKRLFAICHMYGTQYLFSEGDYIMLNKYFNIDIGTRIKVEKVMLVGGDNITLLGRPVLDRDLVNVEATVVEKTMSHTINRVHMVPRRANYRRWRFDRLPLTIIRINKIRICHPINEAPQDVHT